METKIIDGKKISKEILEEVKKEISSLLFQPVFCDILVGEDPASKQYVKMKARTAETAGIHFHNASFPSTITTEDLIKEIKILNEMPNMCGIIVQLPLPLSLNKQAILDSIDPRLDVDCLGTVASKKFYGGETELGFPTAFACMEILDSINLDLSDKKIVVLGQGDLVGKPVTHLLRSRELFVDIITRSTGNKEELIKNADVIISGMGNGRFITGEMIKEGVVLIDAGTSEARNGPVDGGVKIVGDVDLESVKGVAGFVSPVPGGVGPVTVAMLLKNVLKVAKDKNNA